jgi:hypothetical protein
VEGVEPRRGGAKQSALAIIGAVRLVRLRSGHGDQLLAEGDPEIEEQERELIAAFRRQLDLGLWAAVPEARGGRREATLVRSFSEVPRDAERVIFFPPAAGG